jgi:hypothetical protein
VKIRSKSAKRRSWHQEGMLWYSVNGNSKGLCSAQAQQQGGMQSPRRRGSDLNSRKLRNSHCIIEIALAVVVEQHI